MNRKPDLVLRRQDGSVYCNRWHLVPRNDYFNLYLHQFLGDDDDRALHDHPYNNISIVLKSGYWEMVYDRMPTAEKPIPPVEVKYRRCFWPVFRRAEKAHRVILRRIDGDKRMECWSLFITFRRRRVWGFWTATGWVPFNEFLKTPYTGFGDKKALG